VSGFLGVLKQWLTATVSAPGECRQASQEAVNPTDVALPNREDHVFDLYAEKATKATQVLDCPATRSRTDGPCTHPTLMVAQHMRKAQSCTLLAPTTLLSAEHRG
jgi:hypothetical protein